MHDVHTSHPLRFPSGFRRRARRAIFGALGALSLVAIGVACRDTEGRPTDGGPDESKCDPTCHYDCFGGFPQCSAGTLTWFGFGPRPCCGPGAGTYEPGWPVCATAMTACASGACAGTVDPRYAGHLSAHGSFATYVAPEPSDPDTSLDAPRLSCALTAPVEPGSPCTTDRDCRPAPASVAALRCDTASANPTCVETTRPTAPTGYGDSCGLAQGALDAAPVGESIFEGCGAIRTACQVWNDGAGCTAQRCTIACFFDEDCPSGSVCLSSETAIDGLPGYCAPATDRVTESGRFGPTGCP